MEPRSDKHGPRLDEGLKHDTRSVVQGAPVEARAEEVREQEGGGEPGPAWFNNRAELARHLDPSVFPAAQRDLLADATQNGAPDWVVDGLGGLPGDRTFRTTEEVWEALGGVRERRP
ncbi:MAG: DUF2795 domain-containing protein [Acidimicrobiales bacterium]